MEDSLTYFDFHEFWWSKIRTSNCIERLNREIKRRTQIIGVFPNIESSEHLIGAILMEKNEDWMNENAYLSTKTN
ncbi:MAG: transposase [Fibrobacteraceae bacterium]|nr:transposase [Fibrobacteraceae bacterium]